MSNNVLKYGSTIGILGGGQLGQMLSIAASRLGFKVHIFDPQINSPASKVSEFSTVSTFTNKDRLKSFAESVDLITYEFENVPRETVNYLSKFCKVLPDEKALAKSQNRIEEKKFIADLGLNLAPYISLTSEGSLLKAKKDIGFPSIIKTTSFGYDGKGQVIISSEKDLFSQYHSFGKQSVLLEKLIKFDREISVIVARNYDGHVVCYDPGENFHEHGILRTTSVPAKISDSIKFDAIIFAGKIVNALNYIGVMGIEFFVTDKGLLVNEIAPRVHNSGHWTQNSCLIDQFEQHIRAISGWKLGDGKRYFNSEMRNILGSEVENDHAFVNGAIHLYGKNEIRPYRKMGHINQISPMKKQ